MSDKLSFVASEERPIRPPTITSGFPTLEEMFGAKIVDTPARVVYLDITEQGYFHLWSHTSIQTRAIGLTKQFAHLTKHVGMTRADWTQRHATALVEDCESLVRLPMELPEGLASFLGKLNFKEQGPLVRGLFELDQHPEPLGRDRLGELIKNVASYLNCCRSGWGRVASALEWSVDSETLPDQTIAYLAACIGLESLLGDAKTELHTVRLADRYAFLLGEDPDDRAKLAREFEAVFHTRGDLVHARQSRLKGRQLYELQTARRMLQSLLGAELKHYAR